jgi:hypothetical protein
VAAPVAGRGSGWLPLVIDPAAVASMLLDAPMDEVLRFLQACQRLEVAGGE